MQVCYPRVTSVAKREEFHRWLVDCHRASFVPICLTGIDNFLTSEAAATIPIPRDTDWKKRRRYKKYASKNDPLTNALRRRESHRTLLAQAMTSGAASRRRLGSRRYSDRKNDHDLTRRNSESEEPRRGSSHHRHSPSSFGSDLLRRRYSFDQMLLEEVNDEESREFRKYQPPSPQPQESFSVVASPMARRSAAIDLSASQKVGHSSITSLGSLGLKMSNDDFEGSEQGQSIHLTENTEANEKAIKEN